MHQQLVLSINGAADNYRWCWINDGQPQDQASGNLEALKEAVGQATQQVWLLLPGSKVVTRELEYSEKERKHLRNLLPYQLEDAVVGDIDDLHFALGDATAGKVSLAYIDKSWLRSIFEQLAGIGLEITRCWPTPLLLPWQEQPAAPVEPAVSDDNESLDARPSPTWVLSLQEGIVNVRYGLQQGFSVPHTQFTTAIELLIASQHLTENPPYLALRAANQVELKLLYSALPAHLTSRITTKTQGDSWSLDFNGKAIDLCQAEFSQRLPLERWWKMWSGIGILAAVTFVVYIGVTMFHIYKLNKQNIAVRQQIEEVYRGVVPNARQVDDPEKRLRIKLADLQPKAQTGSVVSLLAGVLPLFANNPDVTVKVISYTSETGEMSVNVQAHSFNSIDSLRQSIASQGYNAELLTANAQGDISSGRLKISKPAH